MNTKDLLNFFPIKWFLLFNPLPDSYFTFHWSITSFLLKKKYHKTYYFNKCRMDIYPAVKFMWKWVRPKRGMFLFLFITVIILIHVIFKVNPIVLECTCVSYNIHLKYLFYVSQPSNNLHINKHWSWESNFLFLNEWKLVFLKSKSLLFHIQKNIFHENAKEL